MLKDFEIYSIFKIIINLLFKYSSLESDNEKSQQLLPSE